MSLAHIWRGAQRVGRHHGVLAALRHLLHHAVNRLVVVEHLIVTRLSRQDLRALPAETLQRSATHWADLAELRAMLADPAWDLDEAALERARHGDRCVISQLDGRPVGYLWIHAGDQPELLHGLRLRLAADRRYLYSYASLTRPEGRGHGHQTLRHAAALALPEWADRSGLIAYVRSTNFASRRGLARSGFRAVGSIWVIGRHGRPAHGWFSPALRQHGITRGHALADTSGGVTT